MAVEVTHNGHTYTYHHPSGWSGGDSHVREELNKHLPAGEYSDIEAEEIAARHALRGILSGGEAVISESGKHLSASGPGEDEDEGSIGSSGKGANVDRILDSAEPDDRDASEGGDPERILDES